MARPRGVPEIVGTGGSSTTVGKDKSSERVKMSSPNYPERETEVKVTSLELARLGLIMTGPNQVAKVAF